MKITFKEYILFSEAWLFLATARLLLLFVSFKRIVPLLGKTVAEDKTFNHQIIHTRYLYQISVAVARGCRYSFWRTKCFEQALAAKMMLRRRGLISIIYFGVNKNNDTQKLNAHAWIECNGIIITGGKKLEQYTVVSRFEG